MGGNREKCRQESAGSVGADPDILDNSKKAERDVRSTHGLKENYTSRDSVPPLSRLIRGSRNKYH